MTLVKQLHEHISIYNDIKIKYAIKNKKLKIKTELKFLLPIIILIKKITIVKK